MFRTRIGFDTLVLRETAAHGYLVNGHVCTNVTTTARIICGGSVIVYVLFLVEYYGAFMILQTVFTLKILKISHLHYLTTSHYSSSDPSQTVRAGMRNINRSVNALTIKL